MLQIVKPASSGKSCQSLVAIGLAETDLEASLDLARYDRPRLSQERYRGTVDAPGRMAHRSHAVDEQGQSVIMSTRVLPASGRDLHVGPITDATTHDLPPFADEALSARVQRLTGPEARAAQRSDLMTIAIALTACLFIATLAGAALISAAMRLPDIEQRLANDARV